MKKIKDIAELEPGKHYLIFEHKAFDMHLLMREDGFLQPKCGKRVIAFGAAMFLEDPIYEIFGPSENVEHDYVELNKRIAREGAGEKI